MFEAKSKPNKFKGYICTGVVAYAEQGKAKAELIVDKKERGAVEHVEESGIRSRKENVV